MGYRINEPEKIETACAEKTGRRFAWLTDIHLEFLKDRLAARFVRDLTNEELDGLLLTGDISTAKKIAFHLQLFADELQVPVYFVLGNHDFYGGEIEAVRQEVAAICAESKWLHWLPHFSCQAVGDILRKMMENHPDQQMIVLCGHTHSSGECQVLPNLLVKTGGAQYGTPAIQEIMKFPA